MASDAQRSLALARISWRRAVGDVRLIYNLRKNRVHVCWQPASSIEGISGKGDEEDENNDDDETRRAIESDERWLVRAAETIPRTPAGELAWMVPHGALDCRLAGRLWVCWTCGRTHECGAGAYSSEEDGEEERETRDPCVLLVNGGMEQVCAFSSRIRDDLPTLYAAASDFNDSEQKESDLYYSDKRDRRDVQWLSERDTRRAYERAQFHESRLVREHARQARDIAHFLARAQQRAGAYVNVNEEDDDEEGEEGGEGGAQRSGKLADDRLEARPDKAASTAFVGRATPSFMDVHHWFYYPTALMDGILRLGAKERALLSACRAQDEEESLSSSSSLLVPGAVVAAASLVGVSSKREAERSLRQKQQQQQHQARKKQSLDTSLLAYMRSRENAARTYIYLNPVWRRDTRPSHKWTADLHALLNEYVAWLPECTISPAAIDRHVDRMARWMWLVHLRQPARHVTRATLLAAYLTQLAIVPRLVTDGGGRAWPLFGADPDLTAISSISTLVFTGHDEERSEKEADTESRPRKRARKHAPLPASPALRQNTAPTLREKQSALLPTALLGEVAQFRTLAGSDALATSQTLVEEAEEKAATIPSPDDPLRMQIAAIALTHPRRLPFNTSEDQCTLHQARELATVFLDVIGASSTTARMTLIAKNPQQQAQLASSGKKRSLAAAPYFFQWFHSPAQRVWPLLPEAEHGA